MLVCKWVLALLKALSRVTPMWDPVLLRLCDTSKCFQQKFGLKPENTWLLWLEFVLSPPGTGGPGLTERQRKHPSHIPAHCLDSWSKGWCLSIHLYPPLLWVFWYQCELCTWNQKALGLAHISPYSACFTSEHLQFHLQVRMAFCGRCFVRFHSDREPAQCCWLEEVTLATWT